MSEYWKSTPKYWCKYCKTYVRDTKLEKQNHEATPKHQGNLKRSLRDLHRGHERDERDKERAKAEVARLNGVVAASGSGGTSVPASSGTWSTPPALKPQATAAQRKQQLAQLAEMGISIPDEFRGDLAMAGEWTVTSQRIVDSEEKKPEAIGIGIRKHTASLDDDDLDNVGTKKRKWGSVKTHPDADDVDLDTLLSNPTLIRKTSPSLPVVKQEVYDDTVGNGVESPKVEPTEKSEAFDIKKERSDDMPNLPRVDPATTSLGIAGLKEEVEEPAKGTVVFKKRKAKPIRQK